MSRQPVNGGLSEHSMQSTVIAWAWLQAPSLLALATLFAIPNGGRRAQATANALKREGVRPGVPDLQLPVPAAGYAGLFIEMKTMDGHAGPTQRAWHTTLRALGYRVEVCRTIESACKLLRDHALAWEAESTGEARAALLELWTDFRSTKGKRPGVTGRSVPR